MGWNIDHINFDNIVVHGNNLLIHSDNNQHITLWVEEEIKKASWQDDAIMVYLKNGEARKYLNHMHYVLLQPTVFQKAYQFFTTYAKAIAHRLPRVSRQKLHSKYGISPSANISR